MFLREFEESRGGNQALLDYFRWRWLDLQDLDGFFYDKWEEYNGGDYYASPQSVVRGFADFIDVKFGSMLRAEHAREIPSWFWLEPSPDAILPPTSWCLHLTDHALEIAVQGFQWGVEAEDRLAFTFEHDGYGTTRIPSTGPGYNFAYLLDGTFDPDSRTSDKAITGGYGNGAVVFQTSGVQCHHEGDGEKQVIFHGPSVPSPIIPLTHGPNGWYSPITPYSYPSLNALLMKIVHSR